jgi:asparagine synthase (glutamine-hydrolysing)
MSALNGIFERRRNPASDVAFSSLQSPTDRNFDGSNRWVSTPVSFWSRTNSLLPEEVPLIHDVTNDLVVIADARIDNRGELFEMLHISGAEHTMADACLLLNAWRKWGRESPRYVVGDYSYAIWDRRQQTLFCARDHIGARPFYYSLTTELFVFSSDLKNVLGAPGVSDRLDEDYVVASLADKRFYRRDRTYFTAIRRLAPGHTLTVRATSEQLDQYWFPENAKDIRYANDEDYAEAARDIFVRAIADRLRTHDATGVHLSGGLDSSSVTVLAARERLDKGFTPPTVFSWQPQPGDGAIVSNEYARIKAVCKQEKLTPLFCPMNARDIFAILKKDPTLDPIHITMQIETTIQQRANQLGVRRILSGWGGDEVLSFDGRGYYSQLLLSGRWWRLFRESRKFGSALKFIGNEALLLLFPDRNEALKKLESLTTRNALDPGSFLNPELRSLVRSHKIPCRQTSVRSTLFWLWTRGMLAERMESWAAHGAPLQIEYEYPMLDRRLMEFVAGLPAEQFVRGKWKRWIMRKTMDGILPEEVCWQPDKSEPVRVMEGKAAVYEALRMVREQIISKADLPSRAPYLDMTRLLDRLDPEVLARNPKPSSLTRAVQFLDF